MVVNALNLSTWDPEFEASMQYTLRHCFKKIFLILKKEERKKNAPSEHAFNKYLLSISRGMWFCPTMSAVSTG
jgi:hypothetical protein